MATCYFPKGSKSGGYPCWNTTGSDDFAPCCSDDAYCYSSGWCLSATDMTVYRAGCTDQSWQSDSCVKHCTGANIGGIYKCDDSGNAACYPSDCGTSDQFSISAGSLLLSGPAASSVLSVSGYALATGSSSPSITATVTVTTTPTGGSKSSEERASSAVTGLSVGFGISLLTALTAVFFLLKERKKKQRIQQQRPYIIKSELADTTVSSQSDMLLAKRVSNQGQGLQNQSWSLNSRHEVDADLGRTELL